jgi:hypothetical protein
MKVFVSTRDTQGQRKNDFCYVPEGELVMVGEKCTGGTVDDDCGCCRSMVGLKSRRSTTTFMVADHPRLTLLKYAALIQKSLDRAGWKSWALDAGKVANEIAIDASRYEVGTVMEYRGKGIVPRKVVKQVIHNGIERPEKEVLEEIAVDNLIDHMMKDS